MTSICLNLMMSLYMTEAISIAVQHCYVYDLQNMCICTCHTSAYMGVKACVIYGVKSIMAP